MARTTPKKRAVSAEELMHRAERENPGVSEILKIYARAKKAVDQDVAAEGEQAVEAYYYTADSTSLC